MNDFVARHKKKYCEIRRRIELPDAWTEMFWSIQFYSTPHVLYPLKELAALR